MSFRTIGRIAAGLFVLGLAIGQVAAQDGGNPAPGRDTPRQTGNAPQRSGPQPADSPLPRPPDVTTHHTLLANGKTLAFSATAGTIRLSDLRSGSPTADIGVISYRLDGADARQRPVTFVFNGGPGYASGWLHLGLLGPWRLPMSGDAARPSAAPALIDNADTWLDFTDLVFIDPPGTGYGRIIGGDDIRKSLWSVGGDVNAIAVTIRRWAEANGREISPKFLLGESYGGFRAPKIAHVLQTDQGLGIEGIVMISPVFDFGRFNADGQPLSFVARLPSMVATARERRGAITRADMKDVEDYASGAFLADLMRGVKDAAALDRLAAKLSDLTGLDRTTVRRLAGRLPVDWFAREINRDSNGVSSLYDGNVVGLDPAPFSPRGRSDDQMRVGLHAPITEAMVDLIQHRLGWIVQNGRYQFFNEQAGRQWDYGRGAEAVSDLRSAMALDPNLRVLVMHGLTDLVTPYFESQMVIDQIPDFGTPQRLKLTVYPGGHMIYARDDTRHVMHEDGRALVTGGAP